MAIKAGLVGVNPKGVDKEGMPIGSGGSADAYTKSQTDALLAGKVDKSQLTANSKAFHFAYDATSQKYGYKLDGSGDFIPFEQAGEGIVLNDLINTGITLPNNATYVSGGYETIDDYTYVDLTFKNDTDGNISGAVTGLPHTNGNVYGLWFINGQNAAYVTISSDGSTGSQFIAAGSTIRLFYFIKTS